MSIKMKLVSLISSFILVLALVIAGVLAASSQTINMSGNVQFVVADQSLWVKEMRVQEAGSTSDTITFTPGYINGGFNLDLTSYTEANINNRGSFTIYFDIINTTTTAYDVSVDYSGLSSITGLEVSITSEVPASEEAITTITADTPATTTLELKVVNPNLNTIDLSQIIIIFEEFVDLGNVVNIEMSGVSWQTPLYIIVNGQEERFENNTTTSFTEVESIQFGITANSERTDVNTILNVSWDLTEEINAGRKGTVYGQVFNVTQNLNIILSVSFESIGGLVVG